MIVWLLVLLLLFSIMYVVYRINLSIHVNEKEDLEHEHHYTFKI